MLQTTQVSSASRASTAPPSVIEGFQLAGRSNRPDPATNAYRADLADTALAGCVIASHYADPMPRKLISDATLLASEDGDTICELSAGEEMRLLDISRGWAWGYGPDGRVGYVPANTVGA